MNKKEKIEKYYKEFNECAEEILFKNNIDYDLIELVPYSNGFFGIKIFIENAGKYIIECDKEDYIDFLKEVRDNILENPYKCPFCNKIEPSKTCENCGSKLIESISLSGSKKILSNYDAFNNFAKEIERKTNIPKRVLKIFTCFKGNIKDIIDGVDVVYKGISEWPIFCLSKNIKCKELVELDKTVYEKLMLSYVIFNSRKHELASHQMSFDFDDTEMVLYFENSKYDIDGMVLFDDEINFGENPKFIEKIKLCAEINKSDYVENKLKEEDISLELLDDLNEVFLKKMIEMEDCDSFDDFYDIIGNESYVTSVLPNGFNFKQYNSIKEIESNYLENHFDVFLDEWIKNILKDIEKGLREITEEYK